MSLPKTAALVLLAAALGSSCDGRDPGKTVAPQSDRWTVNSITRDRDRWAVTCSTPGGRQRQVTVAQSVGLRVQVGDVCPAAS